MKKIIFALALIGLCSFVFAQNDEAKAFIAKAKQCETQKKYASALGNYYDAIVADSIHSETAFECFQRIQNQIVSGKPGFDNYNEFTLYDNWVILLKDAEAYWTANCPYVFSFSELKKENVNYEKRTADYNVEVKTAYSEKYLEIVLNTLLAGLKTVYTDSWGRLRNWPQVSAFTEKDGAPAQIYQKYGAAVVNYLNEECRDLRFSYAEAVVLEKCDANERKEWSKLDESTKSYTLSTLVYDRYSNAYFDESENQVARGYFGCASLSIPIRYDAISKNDFFNYGRVKKSGFTDIKLAIVDKSENVIFQSARISAPTPVVMFRYDVVKTKNNLGKFESYNSPYEGKCNCMFNDVPANVMEKIDMYECRVMINAAWLNYGNFHPSLEDWYTRKSVSSLPDIAISTKQIINAEKSSTSVESVLQEKKKLDCDKEAFEKKARKSFQEMVEDTKAEILYETCNKIKHKKNTSIQELIQNAEKIWTEEYSAGKAEYESRKYSNNNNYNIPYPELDSDLAARVIENDAKGKLFTVGKNGTLLLTKEGVQLIKEK